MRSQSLHEREFVRGLAEANDAPDALAHKRPPEPPPFPNFNEPRRTLPHAQRGER